MKDKNLTPGQLRFIWRNYLETRALVITAASVGFVLGAVVGSWWG